MIMKFVLRKNRLFEEYTMAHIKDTSNKKKESRGNDSNPKEQDRTHIYKKRFSDQPP